MSADDHKAALALATDLQIYSYDGYMLLAAQKETAPLLTLDGTGKKPGIIKKAPKVGVQVIELED